VSFLIHKTPNPDQLHPETSTVNDSLLSGPNCCVDNNSHLTGAEKRREWKGAHGIKKYYKTRAEQVMKPVNVEITMGHDIGISESYYKPTEREILDDYLKAVDILTINNERMSL